MKIKRGVFLSDVHLPDNINLKPVFDFICDFKPDTIILGGDIIDAKGLHGAESMKAEQINVDWYTRDCNLLYNFIKQLPDVPIVYLEGNHEERYQRVMKKYPRIFKGAFDFKRDVLDSNPRRAGDCKWVPYGTQKSYYRVGDCVFIHGVKYPDAHAKLYAKEYTPYKVVYGHLHHFQAYTTHRPLQGLSPRYALTAGCLSKSDPEWKKGVPNQWLNGFISFVTDGRTTVPTVHIIEKERFYIGDKCYK